MYAFERFVPLVPKLSPRSSFPPRLNALRKRFFEQLRNPAADPAVTRTFKRSYYKSLSRFFLAKERSCVKGSRHGLYRWFRTCHSGSDEITCLQAADGSVCSSPAEIASVFAGHFSADFSVDDFRDLGLPSECPSPTCSHSPCSQPFSLDRFTPFLVKRTLSKMAPKTSNGPDGLPVFLLKKIAPALALPISELFQRCVFDLDLPDQWKPTRVIPIYKRKGPKQDPASFRPVSLSNALQRCLEKCVNDQLVYYLEANNYLPDEQFGFRKGRSTTSQLICFLDFVSAELAKGESVHCVYLDIKGAFTAPTFSALSQTWSFFRLSANVSAWLDMYLSQREAFVEARGHRSKSYHIASGGVQGSSLSATAFLMLLSPVLSITRRHRAVKCLAFADDIRLFSSDPCALQECLNEIARELDYRQLRLAPHKCEMMTFGNGTQCTFLLNGIPLPVVSRVKDLGVTIDSGLKFTEHVDLISAKARAVCHRILRCFRTRDRDALIMAFRSFVLPLLEYASPCVPLTASQISKLESVQRFFTRRVGFRLGDQREDYCSRLTRCNLSSVASRLRAADLCFAHSIVYQRHTCPLIHLAPPCSRPAVSRRTRLATERKPSRLRSRLAVYRLARQWNRLPPAIMSLKSKTAFRTQASAFSDDCARND